MRGCRSTSRASTPSPPASSAPTSSTPPEPRKLPTPSPLDGCETTSYQRPVEKLRSVQVTSLQLSEEDRALLLGASAAHDLAAVHGLLLLLGRLGVFVAE